jgi:hypothetical protein
MHSTDAAIAAAETRIAKMVRRPFDFFAPCKHSRIFAPFFLALLFASRGYRSRIKNHLNNDFCSRMNF